jgi:hypothetical protein
MIPIICVCIWAVVVVAFIARVDYVGRRQK